MAHPIAAIATGLVRSGIGILRMSGDGCIDLANRVFTLYNGQPLSALPDRKLARGTLFDAQNRPIDEAMVFVSHAPHSYTGEDTVEFQCHGSPAVLTAGLSALLSNGFHQAGPGEFTKRAFLNGQMDLTQAEAVIDLIDAETADAAANAAGQLGGAMLRKIDPIYMSLVDVCSHFHAVLDYPDEDIEPFELRQHRDVLEKAVNALAAILSTFRRGQRLKNGVRAVILGSPNVGKSSLLNALCGYDRVIVTDVAGTTRDTVEESVTLGRHLLRLLDTAGIHETDDRIEKLGVERAVEAVRSAELAIFVCDRSRALNDADREAMRAAMDAPHSIAVLNKSDLPAVLQPSDLPFDCVVPVCAKTGEGLDLFEQALDLVFPEGTPCDGSILTNERQADAVLRAGKSLDAALTSLRQGVTPDAVLVDVEAAMSALGEVTGRTMREDITNRIFERFCVGK